MTQPTRLGDAAKYLELLSNLYVECAEQKLGCEEPPKAYLAPEWVAQVDRVTPGISFKHVWGARTAAEAYVAKVGGVSFELEGGIAEVAPHAKVAHDLSIDFLLAETDMISAIVLALQEMGFENIAVTRTHNIRESLVFDASYAGSRMAVDYSGEGGFDAERFFKQFQSYREYKQSQASVSPPPPPAPARAEAKPPSVASSITALFQANDFEVVESKAEFIKARKSNQAVVFVLQGTTRDDLDRVAHQIKEVSQFLDDFSMPGVQLASAIAMGTHKYAFKVSQPIFDLKETAKFEVEVGLLKSPVVANAVRAYGAAVSRAMLASPSVHNSFDDYIYKVESGDSGYTINACEIEGAKQCFDLTETMRVELLPLSELIDRTRNDFEARYAYIKRHFDADADLLQRRQYKDLAEDAVMMKSYWKSKATDEKICDLFLHGLNASYLDDPIGRGAKIEAAIFGLAQMEDSPQALLILNQVATHKEEEIQGWANKAIAGFSAGENHFECIEALMTLIESPSSKPVLVEQALWSLWLIYENMAGQDYRDLARKHIEDFSEELYDGAYPSDGFEHVYPPAIARLNEISQRNFGLAVEELYSSIDDLKSK